MLPTIKEAKDLQVISTWSELKARFESANDEPTLMGLTHHAYKVSVRGEEEREERHRFMLELADWKTGDHPTPLNDLAFQILSQELFKENFFDEKGRKQISQALSISLLDFFRPRNPAYETGGLRNMDRWDARRSASERAEDFLRQICGTIWRGTYGDELRPRVLRILAARRELHHLPLGDRLSYDQWSWDRFGEAELIELERIALLEHESVEEAVMTGSRAAQLLVIVRVGKAERLRQREEKALEEEIASKTRELHRLKGN